MTIMDMENIRIKLIQIKSLALDTQQLRMKLIQGLQEIFETASRWADDDPEAMRIARARAETISSSTIPSTISPILQQQV